MEDAKNEAGEAHQHQVEPPSPGESIFMGDYAPIQKDVFGAISEEEGGKTRFLYAFCFSKIASACVCVCVCLCLFLRKRDFLRSFYTHRDSLSISHAKSSKATYTIWKRWVAALKRFSRGEK